MANNRLYLCCTICAQREETLFEDCMYLLAKYYPTQGWASRTIARGDLDADLDAWFDKHRHGGLFGEYIFTIYEGLFDPAARAKHELLAGVQHVLDGTHKREPS